MSAHEIIDLVCICVVALFTIAALMFIVACVIYAIKQKRSIDLEDEYLEEEYRESSGIGCD